MQTKHYPSVKGSLHILLRLTLAFHVAFNELSLLFSMDVHRVVADEQRSLALGFISLISRLCGGVPGPLVAGYLFDLSCEYWQYECGERGNCWVYNNQTLSYFILGYSIIVLGAGAVLNTGAWLTYPQKKAQDDVVHKKSEDNTALSLIKMVNAWEIDDKGIMLRDEEHLSEGISLQSVEIHLHCHEKVHMESPV